IGSTGTLSAAIEAVPPATVAKAVEDAPLIAVEDPRRAPSRQQVLMTSGVPRSPASRHPEPLSADRFAVRFTADAEFCELLERVRGLAAHRLPSGDLMTLMKRGLEAYERELKKERFA